MMIDNKGWGWTDDDDDGGTGCRHSNRKHGWITQMWPDSGTYNNQPTTQTSGNYYRFVLNSITSATNNSMTVQYGGLQQTQIQYVSPRMQWTTGIREVPARGRNDHMKLEAGEKMRIELPDGAVLVVEESGAYTLVDKDAKLTYRANRIRDWNPYLNASDLLAEFVQYLGSLGLSRSDAKAIPIELFINWLVIEAARVDGEEAPPDVRVLDHPALPAPTNPRWNMRCIQCRRFIPRRLAEKQIMVCSPEHMQRFLEAA